MRTIVRAIETETGARVKIREDEKLKFEDWNFSNYFYMSKDDYKKYKAIIEKEIQLLKAIESVHAANGEFVKIIFKNNLERYKLKSKFELAGIVLYEADLMANKRILIDMDDLQMNAKGLKWIMYDIETKDDTPLEKDMRGNTIAREPILAIAYKDIDGNEYWMKNKNLEDPCSGEKELLNMHNLIIAKYDVILGWNSYRFDDTFCKQRAELFRIDDTNWKFINQLDYMELIKKNLYPRLPSYSLDNVAKAVLGDQKIEVGEKGNGGILRLWKSSFEGDDTLQRYNMKDVTLMWDMEQKLKFIQVVMNQCNYVRMFTQENLHNSESWDIILLKGYKKRNLIAPTKPNEEEKDRRKDECNVAGAFTFCLNPGVHKDVDVFDFKSFYPTTGDANNICVTTKIDKEYALKNNIPFVTIPADEHTLGKETVRYEEKYFRLDMRGILADAFGELIELRDVTKKGKWKFKESNPDIFMQMESEEWSYKTLANSGYGVVAQKIFRFFDEDVANSITQFCRYVIKNCISIATQNGFKVIQGDTDSIMFKNESKKITREELEIKFAEYFDEFAKQQNINSKKYKHKDLKVLKELKEIKERIKMYEKEAEETGSIDDGEETYHCFLDDRDELESKKIIEKTHFIIFEWEKTFEKMISIKKKNYADLKQERDADGNPVGKPKISVTGLECIKKDTNPLAVILQRRLVEEILLDTIDVDKFIKDLINYKEELLTNKLDPKYLIMKKSLNKNPEDYGKPMIDSKTGLPKMNKNGEMRYAPIPAHVKLAIKLMKEGKEIFVGDQIAYIVKEQDPIVAISVDEYKSGESYDMEYYWERIITPIMKVLFVTNKELIVPNYKLWTTKNLDEKKALKYIEKLEKILSEDEEDSLEEE